MEKQIMESFWKAFNEVQNKPREDRKSMFMLFKKSNEAVKHNIFTVLMLSVFFGGKEGKNWFQEVVSCDDRLNAWEKLQNEDLPKKTMRSLKSALLGDISLNIIK